MTALIQTGDRLGFIIKEWLHSKEQRSHSKHTANNYAQVMMHFRAALQHEGLDLDSDPAALAVYAERWIGMPTNTEKSQLAPTYIKKRLNILSSFYAYAIKKGMLEQNPMNRVEAPTVDEYSGAEPIDARTVARVLKGIKLTILGQRDLALLLVAIGTGRRANELEQMRLGHLVWMGANLHVTFPRVKGGKRKHNTLEPYASLALNAWLIRWYGDDWLHTAGDLPVWARTNGNEEQQGQVLSYWGIRQIFQRRFGVSKVHAARHTFAALMIKTNATLLELMAALGHASLDVTYRYVKTLTEATQENPHGAEIGKLIGFGNEQEGES